MISGRKLSRDEIKEMWAIDRSEVIDAVYYLENGALGLRPEHYDMQGWPPGESEKYTPILEACCDQGGWFYGLFDDQRLLGAAVLESRFIGERKACIFRQPHPNILSASICAWVVASHQSQIPSYLN